MKKKKKFIVNANFEAIVSFEVEAASEEAAKKMVERRGFDEKADGYQETGWNFGAFRSIDNVEEIKEGSV